jgi:hypothetical protein
MTKEEKKADVVMTDAEVPASKPKEQTPQELAAILLAGNSLINYQITLVRLEEKCINVGEDYFESRYSFDWQSSSNTFIYKA